MATPPADNGVLLTWDDIKWIMGATWTAGLAVVGFIWRMALKVTRLEESMHDSEQGVNRRHKENIESRRRLEEELDLVNKSILDMWKSISDRIDRIKDRP